MGSEDPADADLDAYIESAAALQALSIPSEWRGAVRDNLRTIAAAARLVTSSPLDDDIEAAPIFTP